MQLQGAGGTKMLYKNPLECARDIIDKEGWKGLYRGMVPCYLKVQIIPSYLIFRKVIPAIAISFSTYELMRRVLGIEQRKTSFSSG